MEKEKPRLVRIPSLKSVAAFRAHVDSLGLAIPCDEILLCGDQSPLAQPIPAIRVQGKTIANRFAIQPMEGWDGTTTGGVTEPMLRRWQRFGESGAKLIYGGEAMAVRPDGRANPNQLVLSQANQADIAKLPLALLEAHRRVCGTGADPVIGFQLTHSGRFCKPNDKKRFESRVAYRHPILDQRVGGIEDGQVFTDDQIQVLIDDYVKAARLAAEIGADFVDIKHCHGYLLHEFLGAFTRPGGFGGSFANRTRILREIVAGIRASGNTIDLGVRLSAFDFVPFRPDPARSAPGKPGPGIPEEYENLLPYRYGFGVKADHPVEYDLTETFQFIDLCGALGVKLLNISAGSPYYNPHIQRPAAYPPSDGYQPAHDPLIDVARQIDVTRQITEYVQGSMIVIGSAYSYLQEYLPHVAQAVVARQGADVIGLGRTALSYPAILQDAVSGRRLEAKMICRTFSDCTTAPRNGLPSGCYPLDPYYLTRPEAQQLKELKRGGATS